MSFTEQVKKALGRHGGRLVDKEMIRLANMYGMPMPDMIEAIRGTGLWSGNERVQTRRTEQK